MNALGPVETAIRGHFKKVPVVLQTYIQNAPFTLATIDSAGIVLLLGLKKALTPLTWACLEGVPTFLHGRGWIPAAVGGRSPASRARWTHT